MNKEWLAHLRSIGAKGGTKTAKKHGSKYMSELGRRGRAKQLSKK